MVKDFRKLFLGKIKKAITDYGMIVDGDRVAVGMSGGKDSTSLLHALTLISRAAPVKFGLEAVYIDLGWLREYLQWTCLYWRISAVQRGGFPCGENQYC